MGSPKPSAAGIIGYGADVSGTSFKAQQNIGVLNSVNPESRKSMISLTVGTPWNNTNWNLDIKNQVLMTDTHILALANCFQQVALLILKRATFANWIGNEFLWDQL
ncbi:hypothetical protein BGW36DRAFT_432355 [Talaromyces proteolyticus]|uniref:Uncharacterized protein n=1 Tax=Talaromyces proteolyticus TaxID=1131652 RepID=A0AAD4KJ62_9EURO|nr:uncharacterized protein BGW36DRAFT_432355 [Talaromyces proteolyticus]KAH8690557.1 hypothetical protein BGW36DRAFT_432355 [Talaromyces proteolyticus]